MKVKKVCTVILFMKLFSLMNESNLTYLALLVTIFRKKFKFLKGNEDKKLTFYAQFYARFY